MKILFVSLGCDKNTVDTQRMMGALHLKQGYTLTEDENEAQVIVVNTCAFIDAAKQESIDEILRLAELKKTGSLQYLIVVGCLAQRYKDEILKEMPEVDAVVGTTAENSLCDVLDSLVAGEKSEHAILADPNLLTGGSQDLALGSHVGFLKIAEGCNKCCTYCAIPLIRGKYRSTPMEQIMEEAQHLVLQGANELILVAQETTVYGVDLYGKKMLPELLRRLCLIQGVRWIRVLYCYPEEITDELIEVMRTEEKVVPYLDLPIQHCSDAILKRMGRKATGHEIEEMVEKLRDTISGICLRTTLITGFPGETQEDHEKLLDFVCKMRFDHLGVYTYSREEDTPAASFPNQVHPSTKKHRQKELMLAQQKIAFEQNEELIGNVMDLVVDGRIADAWSDRDYVYVGRTYRDIPDVDSVVYVESNRDLLSGTFVRVRITGSEDYDLTGEIVDESSE